MTTLKPQVTWAERKDTAFITVDLADVKDLKIDLEEESLSFHAVSDGNMYDFNLTFPDKVDKEASKYSSSRLVHILLHKKEAKRWGKITTDKSKAHWLKCDWDKWLDTDEEEAQANKGAGYGDMDYSQLMGGMGGMGDMMGGMGGTGNDMFGAEEDDMDGEESDGEEDLDELDAPIGEEKKDGPTGEKNSVSEKEKKDVIAEESKNIPEGVAAN